MLSTMLTWSCSPAGCHDKLQRLLHMVCHKLKLGLLGHHLCLTVLQSSLHAGR
jgi:hypothetical protein